ncbi:hypothetical protein CYLTODRAFT_394299 [Cylindrobasidium torrendii FP15055 ss-10]|uniref:RecQ-mediated genome instability protein 1 n=1 Tax=Cylindrobasidium torrendii FP15055 ss-10 TaxID=1314674 RepID=A0A0D7BG65_9AGAR|nr:hypothetical protein CYLTODRAFT_394299 [Cylindrobasidium torrendii FP15055 ss-10]
MSVPAAITQYLSTNYPRPRVDPEWLQACYDWIIDEKNLHPTTDMGKIIKEVEEQLLSSSLSDSMMHGTGLPINIPDTKIKESRISGSAVLVEIVSITDIGASAFSLNKVRLAREERLAAGESEEGEGDVEVDGEGPVPNYPRSMLSFEISDGAVTLKAMEYRSLPQMKLGVTPLGYKLLLKDCRVRRGIALLEPACVAFKEHMTEDLETNQRLNFQRGLHLRLGIPEPDVDMTIQAPPPPPPEPRSPLRAISPPVDPLGGLEDHLDDLDEPRRRRIPADTQATLISPSTRSSFFTGPTQVDGQLRGSLPLAHNRRIPLPAEPDDEEDNPVVRGAPSDFSDDMFDNQDDDFWNAVDTAATGGPNPTPPPARSNGPPADDTSMDVIEISDDEDKENVPAPQRHVKRRIEHEQELDDDIIELSD